MLVERRHNLELLVRPTHPVWKEAGRLAEVMYKEGFDGWVTWGLPKFGQPQPWSQEEITVWCAMLKRDIDEGYHIYHNNKRVWAQKPFDSGPDEVVARELELRDVEKADEAQGKE